ncbi:unnamed protein product [Protopolystoma xenopodis]|uniref:Uncharacterized protein n=1 Tax=Protopolystoma xenopodis TaxID=117903 RepID=A0A3S5A6Q2_9PLAT|nr:unnamed protein product [Protopolystoma xenopodis]
MSETSSWSTLQMLPTLRPSAVGSPPHDSLSCDFAHLKSSHIGSKSSRRTSGGRFRLSEPAYFASSDVGTCCSRSGIVGACIQSPRQLIFLVIFSIVHNALYPCAAAHDLAPSTDSESVGMSSRDLCRSVCTGCIAGSLSCQSGGLSQMPTHLEAGIDKVGKKLDNLFKKCVDKRLK